MSLLNVSIVKKVVMSLTGLFLVLFLVIHLLGNLQLLMPAEKAQESFNLYSEFMANNPLIQIVSKVTMAFFLLHTILSIRLSLQNRSARPINYSHSNNSSVKTLASKYMLQFGIIIFIFLVIHLKSFWYEMKFGSVALDSFGRKDLYGLTVVAFQQLWYVALYVVAILILGFHLLHGFESAFQSLGLSKNNDFNRFISSFGKYFSIIITVLYAVIPIYIFLFR